MKRIHIICFSPTGSTRKLAEAVAEGLGLPVTVTDCTMPSARDGAPDLAPVLAEDELPLLAAPVYYGRVQAHAASCFKALKGGGRPAVLLVNYGNRHYDDAVRELYDIALASDLKPVTAAAFVSEHSFSIESCPMAAGRPDADDLAKARDFGREARKALDAGRVMAPPSGAGDYKPYPDFHRAPTSNEACTLCGVCVSVCPVAAISIEDGALVTDEPACIVCQACVKSCPEGARNDTAPGAVETRAHLKKLGLTEQRREPEYFGV